MDPLYDIYLTGKLAEGLTATEAGTRLARLFKADASAMTALLDGRPRLLKRGVDRATALKYREALGRIGIEPAFKSRPAPEPAGDTAWTLAPAGADVLSPDERRPLAARTVDTSALSLAPADAPPARSDPNEARAPDVGHLSLADADGDLLTPEERAAPPVPAPTPGDWTLAPAGSPLETLPRGDTGAVAGAPSWSLAPAGPDR